MDHAQLLAPLLMLTRPVLACVMMDLKESDARMMVDAIQNLVDVVNMVLAKI